MECADSARKLADTGYAQTHTHTLESLTHNISPVGSRFDKSSNIVGTVTKHFAAKGNDMLPNHHLAR